MSIQAESSEDEDEYHDLWPKASWLCLLLALLAMSCFLRTAPVHMWDARSMSVDLAWERGSFVESCWVARCQGMPWSYGDCQMLVNRGKWHVTQSIPQ